MKVLIIAAIVVVVLLALGFALSVRVVKQYQLGVLFRLGRVLGPRQAGAAPDHPGRGCAAPGLAADRDDADPVLHHHPRQRQWDVSRSRISRPSPSVLTSGAANG